MIFSEYALGLLPYISGKSSKGEYLTELIGNFIQDGAMDACPILQAKADTKCRYINGTRRISPQNAQYLYNHRDIDKFTQWLGDRMDDSDSFENVADWLHTNGIDTKEPDSACAELLENIFLDTSKGSKSDQVDQESAIDMQLIEDIQKKIELLPRPADVPVPKEATQDERVYIKELYNAYGDAEGLDSFSEKDLSSYPEYAEDLDDRRIDYYAAESIRRGVLELKGNKLIGQFEVLKSETLDGVKDTAKRTHINGYEHMLAVMEQAVDAPISNYILCASPYWINGKIKKGVCHHLVNDGKLVWIKRRKRQ